MTRFRQDRKVNERLVRLFSKNIKNHDNKKLRSNMRERCRIVSHLGETDDFASLFRDANEANNSWCIHILMSNGLNPQEQPGPWTHIVSRENPKPGLSDTIDAWEKWQSNPLRWTLSKVNLNVIEEVFRAVYKTRLRSTCPKCIECGWPEICIFETLFSAEKMETLSDDNLLGVLRECDWDHVLSGFSRLIYYDQHAKMMNSHVFKRIQFLISKTIPVIRLKSIEIYDSNLWEKPITMTNENKGHIMNLVRNNMVDIDSLFRDTARNFLGGHFGMRGDMSNMFGYYEKCFKIMIDLGADTSTPFPFSDRIVNYSVTKRVKTTFGWDRIVPFASFEDMVQYVLSVNKSSIYRRKDFCGVVNELCNYIRNKKRLAYIHTRVRGFSEEEEIDEVTRRFVNLDIDTFANVLGYLV